MTAPVATKVCTQCGREKPLSEFPPHRGKRRDGVQSYCRTCHASSLADKRVRNPEFRQQEREANNARTRALWKLARRHPTEFAILVQQELASPKPKASRRRTP